MNNQAATGWGEIKRRKRIKNRIMTGAWALVTIGMGIALIVWIAGVVV